MFEQLDRIECSIKFLGEQMAALDDALTALTAKVTAEDTVIDSAVTLIQGIPALISAAVTAALAQGATPAQLQAITDLGTTITAKSDALAAAVTANTPAAPPTPAP
jgi:hypothetical protein